MAPKDCGCVAKRRFIAAYAEAYVEALELRCREACPTGFNTIDRHTLQFAYNRSRSRAGEHFRSWEAFKLYDAFVTENMDVMIVSDKYWSEPGLTDDYTNSVFYRWENPFLLIRTTWRSDFIVCLNELFEQ